MKLESDWTKAVELSMSYSPQTDAVPGAMIFRLDVQLGVLRLVTSKTSSYWGLQKARGHLIWGGLFYGYLARVANQQHDFARQRSCSAYAITHSRDESSVLSLGSD